MMRGGNGVELLVTAAGRVGGGGGRLAHGAMQCGSRVAERGSDRPGSDRATKEKMRTKRSLSNKFLESTLPKSFPFCELGV